jgi:hypothetical protein
VEGFAGERVRSAIGAVEGVLAGMEKKKHHEGEKEKLA